MREDTFNWLNVERIAEELALRYPEVEPLEVGFSQLRDLVEGLPGFAAHEGHACNEKILEAIQMSWHDEHGDEDDGRD